MSLNEKNMALGVVRPVASRQPSGRSDVLPTVEDVDSTYTLTPTPTDTQQNKSARDTSPFSPFYSHGTTCNSKEALRSESKVNLKVYENDLEGGLNRSRTSVMTKSDPNCTVWPGQNAQKKKFKAARLREATGCNYLMRYSKRTRRSIQTVIALLVIGCIIAVGLGVNKAVGGTVYQS